MNGIIDRQKPAIRGTDHKSLFNTSTAAASATAMETTPAPTNTPAATNTPTATETQELSPSGIVNTTTIFYDGAGSQEPDEYVEIKNDDTKPIQLQNWTLRDVANHVFTFPSFVFQPEQVCRVCTNEVHPEWCGFSYGSGSAIWNKTGDTATLRDGNGSVVDTYTYQ